jgi:hypothetical protein
MVKDYAALTLLPLTACGPRGGSADAATTAQGTSEATLESSSTDPDPESETDASEPPLPGIWEVPSDYGTAPHSCDPFAQDCPAGEKCVPYDLAGNNWNANKCAAVVGDRGAHVPARRQPVRRIR